MPLDNINIQPQGDQGGLILNALRMIGTLAGKKNPERVNVGFDGLDDPGQYKTGFWDSVMGGQGSRLNTAMDVDKYNRASGLSDAASRISTAQALGRDNFSKMIPLESNARQTADADARTNAVESATTVPRNIDTKTQLGLAGDAARRASETARILEEERQQELLNKQKMGQITAGKLGIEQDVFDRNQDAYANTQANQYRNSSAQSQLQLGQTQDQLSPILRNAQQQAAESNARLAAAKATAAEVLQGYQTPAYSDPAFKSLAYKLPMSQIQDELAPKYKVIPKEGSLIDPEAGMIYSPGIDSTPGSTGTMWKGSAIGGQGMGGQQAKPKLDPEIIKAILAERERKRALGR